MVARVRVPLGGERAHDHGLHDLQDLLAVGVVGAERRPLARGVKRRLEQSAEDGGVDLGPVVLGGGVGDQLQVAGLQVQHLGVVEQAAVEPVDHVRAEEAARAHLGEQLGELGAGQVRPGLGAAHHPGEQVGREQAGVLGEHAEHQPVQEVRHRAGVLAALLQAGGQLAEAPRHLGGQLLGADAGLEAVGAAEDLAQDVELGRLQQVRQGQLNPARDRVCPVGVDDDPLHVADDQIGRVLQVERIGLELAQRSVQVLVLALVLPAEAALAPDVRPAVSAAGLGRPALEAVALAMRIVFRRRGLAEQPAQVQEVLLAALALA